MPGSAVATFKFKAPVKDKDYELGHLEIAFVSRYTNLPSSDYFNQFIDLTFNDRLAIPDSDQLSQTQGNLSISVLPVHGFTTFKRLELALFRHSGKSRISVRSWIGAVVVAH